MAGGGGKLTGRITSLFATAAAAAAVVGAVGVVAGDSLMMAVAGGVGWSKYRFTASGDLWDSGLVLTGVDR